MFDSAVNMNDSWPDGNATTLGRDGYSTVAYLWICASPFVFFIGIIGNSLSLIVFRRMGYGRSPINVHMSCIATVDNGVLLFGLLPQWLKESGFVALRELSPASCKISYFCTFTSGDTAVWLLAVFTVDRAVAVRFPLRHFRPRHTHSVLAMCAFLLACSCAKNAHIFWTRGAVFDSDTGNLISNCQRAPGYERFEAFVRPWIAFSTVSVAPFLVVLISNAVIIRVLVTYNDPRRKNAIVSNTESHFRQTILMCLAVSIAFFVCVTPNFALLIGRPYWKAAVSDRSAFNVIHAVNSLLLYTNHSINFYLYCLTGKVFRTELLALISRRRPSLTMEYNNTRGRDRVSRFAQYHIVAGVHADHMTGWTSVLNHHNKDVGNKTLQGNRYKLYEYN